MAQGGPQLDYQILHDLKQRFPEIPEGVVSQYLLQNNNNLDVCCHLLAQESNRYLYEEYHSSEEGRLSRNHMLHINLGSLGYPLSEGGKANGVGRTLVHSSSDGHLEPQRGGAGGAKQPQMVFPEPHSAPATMAPSPGYNPFFINEQGRSAGTRPAPRAHLLPRAALRHEPHHRHAVPEHPGRPPGAADPRLRLRQRGEHAVHPAGPSQSPQPSPWPSPVLPVYQPSPYPGAYPSKQMAPTVYHSPPPAQFPSPYSSPQHQIQQTSHVLLPISPPTYQHQQQQQQPPANPAYTFKIKVSPGRAQRPSESPTVETESLLNMVDQADHPAAPAPILPISLLPGNIASQINHMPRRSSSGSDDYAYTQALLLHQRARMERLVKELLLERQKLEQLKSDVNDMEYDLLQRRFHRVNSSSLIPRPEDMTRLRSLNRQLQIDIDCTLKETDLLQSRGKFDPKAMNNFYDNIQPGPVVPPKPVRKDGGGSSKAAGRPAPRDEDFEGVQWNCESCTFLNHPALNRCEQCEMPRYT
ncbi:hypothetical protein ANANG_G00275110 [Anguilla anguilla]|uniref:TGF-beta activated kinase 1 (MAP3K7) binding protein 3 n=1 Tax=Anguilla anguilla TaxID=7936 RepID=A0A9D3LMI2_ANGAN|nr:hypothetical protein ANANG_G00275110 [Anguilla anguilla]